MGSNGVLFGQIVLVAAILVCGVWFATQWTAAELGYQMRLGAPWFVLHGLPVYHPWRLFQWWFVYESYAPCHATFRRPHSVLSARESISEGRGHDYIPRFGAPAFLTYTQGNSHDPSRSSAVVLLRTISRICIQGSLMGMVKYTCFPAIALGKA